MLTSKQRSVLRGLANPIETIFHIGKGGITQDILRNFEQALDARELVKANVLDNCMLTARDAANYIAGKIHAEVVMVIGNKFVLYRKSRTNPKIEI